MFYLNTYRKYNLWTSFPMALAFIVLILFLKVRGWGKCWGGGKWGQRTKVNPLCVEHLQNEAAFYSGLSDDPPPSRWNKRECLSLRQHVTRVSCGSVTEVCSFLAVASQLCWHFSSEISPHFCSHLRSSGCSHHLPRLAGPGVTSWAHSVATQGINKLSLPRLCPVNWTWYSSKWLHSVLCLEGK